MCTRKYPQFLWRQFLGEIFSDIEIAFTFVRCSLLVGVLLGRGTDKIVLEKYITEHFLTGQFLVDNLFLLQFFVGKLDMWIS